jgi:hypothetical protein
MKYKINIKDEIHSLEELKRAIEYGSRFIAFQYCITVFFAVTLTRFSPAILIRNDEEIQYFRAKYNRLTKFFGWWGIPWGPIKSVNALNTNKAGGIDMTDDIMLNIDSESFLTREVELKLTNQLFCKPNKTDIKAFNKALVNYPTKNIKVKKIVVGIFINTSEPKALNYTVGIKSENNFDDNIEELRKLFYTQFRKYVHFEFINLNEINEVNILFEKQGETLISK